MGGDFRAERLRVNLRLVINRLKLLEKKKTELAQKSRREIADYLSTGKGERARIRVEHIIREDYVVEAMEILELFCELLLARFGLVQSMRELDAGLAEAAATLVWAAPRLQSEVAELRVVSDQLCAKYGREFGRQSRGAQLLAAGGGTNAATTVNERLMRKLSVEAPPRDLVENYLVEIAKNYNVTYEPDDAELGPESGGGGVGGGSALTQVCTCSEVKDLIDMGSAPVDHKSGRGGGRGGGGFTTPAAMLMPTPTAFNYPVSRGGGQPAGTFGGFQPSARGGGGGGLTPLTPQASGWPPTYGPALGASGPYGNDGLPELPSVPDTLPAGMAADSVSTTSSTSEDIDFDDLTRRFEALKNNT